MKLSATEKRIYALAQKWAKETPRIWQLYGTYRAKTARRNCGNALLKLFKKGRKSVRAIRE